MKKIILLATACLVTNIAMSEIYTQYGNTVYSTNGTTYTTYGNATYGSDGTMYTKYGNTLYTNDGKSYTFYA